MCAATSNRQLCSRWDRMIANDSPRGTSTPICFLAMSTRRRANRRHQLMRFASVPTGTGGWTRRATLILVLAATFHLFLAAIPDSMGDLLSYRVWTRALVHGGLTEAYWPPSAPANAPELRPVVDYPPVFPYLLWALVSGLASASGALLNHDWLLDLLTRLLLSVAGLLTAVLIYGEARRVSPAGAELLLGAVALNPALVFNTAYWGQADAIWVLLLIVALLALARGHPEWAWTAVA